jgi:hypothetical protein
MADKVAAESKGAKLYVCENPACPLGSRATGGVFAGGITAEQRNMLTGEPVEHMKKGVHYGEGFCPNCGEEAKPYDRADERAAHLREQIKAMQDELKGLK